MFTAQGGDIETSEESGLRLEARLKGKKTKPPIQTQESECSTAQCMEANWLNVNKAVICIYVQVRVLVVGLTERDFLDKLMGDHDVTTKTP